MKKGTLFIVYNADAGILNGVKDSLHKLFSPNTYPCKLCDLTHGYLHERKGWSEFIKECKESEMGVTVLHKDELSGIPFAFESLPGVYLLKHGQLTSVLNAIQLKEINSITDLTSRLREELDIFSISENRIAT